MVVFSKRELEQSLSQALAVKGARKFVQSVDLSVSFKDLDFKKAENRLNLSIVLPHAPKAVKIGAFADGQRGLDAKNAGADWVVGRTEIEALAQDRTGQKKLLSFAWLSTPELMTVVGKNLGQLLGGRGKLPQPVPPNSPFKDFVERARRSVVVKSKGKYLPSAGCVIGSEQMAVSELADNAIAVMDAVLKKVTEQQMKRVFVKTTMGKPIPVKAG